MGKALVLALFFIAPAALFATSEIFSVGSSVAVDEPVDGDVTVFWAGAEIGAPVKGTITVVGGSLVLKKGVKVEGDVVVVFGMILAEEGAVIEGEKVTIGATIFTGSEKLSPRTVLFLLILWLTLGLALLGWFPNHVLTGSQLILTHPGRVLLSGLLFLLTGSLLLLLGFLLSGVYIGFPIILLVILSLLSAKIYGITLLMYSFGRILTGRGHALVTFAAGVLFIFAVRLIPVAGPVLWSLLTLPALGVTLLQVSRSRYYRKSLFSAPILSRS